MMIWINRKKKRIKIIYNPLKKDEINDLFYKIRDIKVECTIYYEDKNEIHYSPFLKKTINNDAISVKISLNKNNKEDFEKINIAQDKACLAIEEYLKHDFNYIMSRYNK